MRKAAPEGKGYANLLQAALSPEAKNEVNIEQIDKDLWRTGLPAFKKDQGEEGEQMVQKLRRVLLAYRSANSAPSSSVCLYFAVASPTLAPT